MYNRYIPQPDGSYRRSRMPDPPNRRQTPQPKVHEEKPESHCDPEPTCVPEPEEQTQAPRRQYMRSRPCQNRNPTPRPQPPKSCPRRDSRQENSCEEKDGSVANFFRQLLPKDFDTGDLLVVLLLLLMSGDCAEDQNSALLTLVLYLFM